MPSLQQPSRIDFADHYWTVGGSTTQVYSSARGDYVPIDDAAYQSWLAAGRTATDFGGSETELGALLGPHRTPRPNPAAILDGYKEGQAAAFTPFDQTAKFLHWLTNEVRVLQGKPTITFEQFRQAIKDRM